MQRPDLAKPTLAMFARGNSGWAKNFVNSLIQGEPEQLPDEYQTESGRAAVYNAAKALKVTVKSLNFNDRIWVCKLSGGEPTIDDD